MIETARNAWILKPSAKISVKPKNPVELRIKGGSLTEPRLFDPLLTACVAAATVCRSTKKPGKRKTARKTQHHVLPKEMVAFPPTCRGHRIPISNPVLVTSL